MLDRESYAAIGGDEDTLVGLLRDGWREGMSAKEAIQVGRKALMDVNGSEESGLDERALEIALLDRTRQGRKFKRLRPPEIAAIIR
jgi:proteasome alpha subunit